MAIPPATRRPSGCSTSALSQAFPHVGGHEAAGPEGGIELAIGFIARQATEHRPVGRGVSSSADLPAATRRPSGCSTRA